MEQASIVTFLKHLVLSELFRVALPIIAPIFALFMFLIFLKSKIFSRRIKVLKYRVKGIINKYRIDGIYKNEKENRIEEELIKNAFNEARSQDPQTKRNAIAQLGNFGQHPDILHGIIKLLAEEEDLGFRKIIITTLCSIHN